MMNIIEGQLFELSYFQSVGDDLDFVVDILPFAAGVYQL